TDVAGSRPRATERPRPRRTRSRTRDEHRRQQPEACDLAVPLVGGAVLRRLHFDLLPVPGPRYAVPQGPPARAATQHPVYVRDVVHLVDELIDDGAGARGDPARRRTSAA